MAVGEAPFPRKELPPRARRIRVIVVLACIFVGTTSACAENTTENTPGSIKNRNYLRVRGEYTTEGLGFALASELPPRARRIRVTTECQAEMSGTTSACAENTQLAESLVWHPGNYLRVRGEYRTHRATQPRTRELPPRARRILRETSGRGTQGGTTSACAENTFQILGWGRSVWNYLRVRGEYGVQLRKPLICLELPPRARRIP